MPLYEYACGACNHTFEVEQKITARKLKKCPLCKRLKLQRLISSTTSFQLKGGGWYADGYTGNGASTSTKE